MNGNNLCPWTHLKQIINERVKFTYSVDFVAIYNAKPRWDQDFWRSDINLRWRECWNVTRDITVNGNLRLT